jgi:hypothetical protein
VVNMQAFLLLVVVAGAIGITAVAGGAIYLERHDPFCAARHTQPETTYYERSVGRQTGAIDLA